MTQQAELLQKIYALSPEHLGEVISFVGYLQQKEQPKTVQIDNDSTAPLSKQFAGTLQLSDSDYEAVQNSLQEGRSEWNRNIF